MPDRDSREPPSRLLTARNLPPDRKVVGACAVCGVGFAASAGRRAHAEQLLRVHQSICPGGNRAGHIVEPFE
jgi:hypothetical protein